MQHAVDAKADARLLLIRLDVYVRSVFLDGIEQKLVDKAYDGSVDIFGAGGLYVIAVAVVFGRYVDVFERVLAC